MHPQPDIRFRFWYQKPKIWIAIGILACAGFLAAPYARRIYHRWTGVRKVERAEKALQQGNYDEAKLNARGALATNAKDIEATRIMAKTAEAVGVLSQAIQFRRQLDALKPRDAENLLALAESYLKIGDPSAAEEAMKSLTEADQATARYHDVASAVALARGDGAGAESHAAVVVKLAPTDDNYQLRLALLRLNSTSQESRAQALAALEELSTRTSTRTVALRALLSAALKRGDGGRARELADAIAAIPEATFEDKLAQLGAWNALRSPDPKPIIGKRAVRDSEFFALLGQFQELAASKPGDISKLVAWMNEHHLALMVPEWVGKLPADLIAKPPVCVAVADAHARGSNWKKLKDSIENAEWGEMEFLRSALLARALERLKDEGGCSVAWNRALQAARDRPAALERLAREAIRWGWQQRAEELLWKLAGNDPCPRWVADNLWELAAKRLDAEALGKISKIILAAEPRSVKARNSYVSFLLLTNQEPDISHSMAAALYKEHSADVGVVATYAYSLHLQGRQKEAASALSALPPETLREPWLAFHYATILVAAGEFDQAEEYVLLGASFPKFSQQQGLADFLAASFDVRAADRKGDSAAAAALWKKALIAAQIRPEWLETLGQMALKWDWKGRTEEVVLKLAEAGRCPPWAADFLWATALQSGDNTRIYKAARLIMSVNPKSLLARSTFITVALLARNEADAPHRLAEALAGENPGNSEAAATYSFSLYRQGKIEESMAVLRALQPDQLREPRTAFYHALVLAAAGQPDQAEEYLALGCSRPLLPEEKAVSEILRQAYQWRLLSRRGDGESAAAAWHTALSAARERPDLLESMARMAIKWEAPEQAEAVLWKLADGSKCPRWGLDVLSAAAVKRRDSAQLYKVSQLMRKAEPNSVIARNNTVWLSLLTGQDTVSAHRQAKALLEENPGDSDVAVTYALSLHLKGKASEAVAILGALRPEQLRAPKPALYFGMFLASAGESGKAREYIELGSKAPVLPEEQAMFARIKQPH
jgi:Tfp pilus assembly protein PilF